MNTKHLLLSLLALLGSTTLHAYDAYIDGIYYNFNASARTATVTFNSSNKYTGDVIIPATVTSGDTIYSVKSVGYWAFSGCSGLTSITIPHPKQRDKHRRFCFLWLQRPNLHHHPKQRDQHRHFCFRKLQRPDLHHHPQQRDKHRRLCFQWLQRPDLHSG